jgi:hypothetical protein
MLQKKCKRVMPNPSPPFLGSVTVPVTLAVPKQLLPSPQSITLGRQATMDLGKNCPPKILDFHVRIHLTFNMTPGASPEISVFLPKA